MLTDETLTTVCKLGHADCCRYLTLGPDGFSCEKCSPRIKKIIDARVAVGAMMSTGDNCEGKP